MVNLSQGSQSVSLRRCGSRSQGRPHLRRSSTCTWGVHQSRSKFHSQQELAAPAPREPELTSDCSEGLAREWLCGLEALGPKVNGSPSGRRRPEQHKENRWPVATDQTQRVPSLPVFPELPRLCPTCGSSACKPCGNGQAWVAPCQHE